MKYGMRERLSGAVILIALAVIFVPMLFDEPAPRGERPEPTLTIEQPVPVERQDVPDPQPPESLGDIQSPLTRQDQASTQDTPEVILPSEATLPEESEDADGESRSADAATQAPEEAPGEEAETPPTEPGDPIAELARAASERLDAPSRSEPDAASDTAPAATPEGEWAVQVGSFGEPANAERLEAQLREQGFPAYRERRDNNLTTVYVGPYDASETGERVMAELKATSNLQGLLVRVRE